MRYFDPGRRGAGVPEDVAALVEQLSADGVILTLINTDPETPREVVVQAGAYGEYKFVSAVIVDDGDSNERSVGRSAFTVRLGPSADIRLDLRMRRYTNQPTFDFPWGRNL